MYIRVWEETNFCFSRIIMGLIIMVTIMGWYEFSSPETRIYQANQLINILEIWNENPLCNISLFYSFLGSSNFSSFRTKLTSEIIVSIEKYIMFCSTKERFPLLTFLTSFSWRKIYSNSAWNNKTPLVNSNQLNVLFYLS